MDQLLTPYLSQIKSAKNGDEVLTQVYQTHCVQFKQAQEIKHESGTQIMNEADYVR